MSALVIVSARRTPQGRLLGALKTHSAVDLGVAAARGALEGISSAVIDQVIVGNVLAAGLGMNMARQVALRAGLGEEVPAYTVNMMCGSGMKAVILACETIRCGQAEVVLCGGSESMSNAPWVLQRAPDARRIGADGRADTIQCDGLVDPLLGEHMGLTAERLATLYAIDRGMQDGYAERSHRLYGEALAAGHFASQLVDIADGMRDEHPRPGITLAKLGALRPAFSATGTITPGNASGINDGAAMLVVASAAAARRHGWTTLAQLTGWASVGCSPATMGLGPVHAIRKLRTVAGSSLQDYDRFEINEAFAAQTLACIQELGLDLDRVNGDGGAIALGHPLGASGARLLVHLSHCTAHGRSRNSVASVCIGGGMGLAVSLSA